MTSDNESPVDLMAALKASLVRARARRLARDAEIFRDEPHRHGIDHEIADTDSRHPSRDYQEDL